MKFRAFGYTLSIHKEGKPYVFVFGGISLLFLLRFGFHASTLMFFFVMLCIIGFFRDPERITPEEDGLIVAPSDGIIVDIKETKPLADLDINEESVLKVSIFLSVFDVHVTRVPIAGKIVMARYHRGKFLNASFDKASEENERNSITIESESGERVGCVQIAGFVARRIVSNAEVGSFFGTAERYGIIKFGSRVDLYLPKSCKANVLLGQKVVGGETVISRLK